MKRVLGIETSCDETAVAIVTYDGRRFCVEHSEVASQIDTHALFGGVVPEVAARMHVPVLPRLLERAQAFDRDDINAVAVTTGPGLATALRVGVETAKALCAARAWPLVCVDHIEGHLYSAMLWTSHRKTGLIHPPTGRSARSSRGKILNVLLGHLRFFRAPERRISSLWTAPQVPFHGAMSIEGDIPRSPALCLIVSGGHTELVFMREHGVYEYLGETRDDAAGEAFDKTAALLGLPYPGGPSVSREAARGVARFALPRPMLEHSSLDFSFSGLKTAVRLVVEAVPVDERTESFVADVCRSFEDAVVDVLGGKTARAIEACATPPRSLLVGGGVAANATLRARLAEAFGDRLDVRLPSLAWTTDNAAMIAAAGAARLVHGGAADDVFAADADPHHRLGESWEWEQERV